MFVLNILFVLFCATSIRGAEVVCEYEDTDCMTKAGKYHYDEFVAGKDNLWASCDPLQRDQNEVKSSNLSCIISSVNLTGMQQCTVELLGVVSKKLKFNLECPQLIGDGQCDITGYIDNVYIKAEGSCQVTRDSYNINLDCDYESATGEDEEEHMQLSNCVADLKCDGKVAYSFEKLTYGDETSADAATEKLNANWERADEVLSKPSLKELIENIFVTNCNNYLQAYPAKTIFSYEE